MDKAETITEALRQAVKDSGLSQYAICKATGMEPCSLMRFADGRTSLRLDKADALAEFLGLVLVKKGK